MMDYINRQAVLDSIREDPMPISLEMVVKHFRSAPAADVAPVMHGAWVDAHGDRRVAECSACKEQSEVTFDGPSSDELFAWFARFYRFCPSCGARMDGGAEDG